MAFGDRYYYLSALPALGDLGSTPPITPSELLASMGTKGAVHPMTEAILLHDDLLQREAFLAGETTETEPAVLSERQARNEAPLPSYLVPAEWEAGPTRVAPVDTLWETYFRHASETAARYHNRFLAGWVQREVGIRNALAAARAKRLGLDINSYLVATDLLEEQSELSTLVGEWEAASDPLEANKTLIRARWAWVLENSGWFSFKDDEVVAYAAQLMLLQQWRRLAAATHEESEAGGGSPR